MKEVPKKDLPDVSGGEYQSEDGGCIPFPNIPGVPGDVDWAYPQAPVIQAPDVNA
jgi:hypothetical protein